MKATHQTRKKRGSQEHCVGLRGVPERLAGFAHTSIHCPPRGACCGSVLPIPARIEEVASAIPTVSRAAHFGSPRFAALVALNELSTRRSSISTRNWLSARPTWSPMSRVQTQVARPQRNEALAPRPQRIGFGTGVRAAPFAYRGRVVRPMTNQRGPSRRMRMTGLALPPVARSSSGFATRAVTISPGWCRAKGRGARKVFGFGNLGSYIRGRIRPLGGARNASAVAVYRS